MIQLTLPEKIKTISNRNYRLPKNPPLIPTTHRILNEIRSVVCDNYEQIVWVVILDWEHRNDTNYWEHKE